MSTWRDVTILDKCVKKLKKAIKRGCYEPCCYHTHCRKTTINRNCLTQLEHEQLLSTPKGYIFVGDAQRRAELKKCTKDNVNARLGTGDMRPTVASVPKQYTIASLCNYFNSLVIQCNSPAWRQEFLSTVMNSVQQTITRDISEINTSKTANIILKILDNITNSKTNMSSPKDRLQEVQVYLTSALAPWLEKPTDNICAVAGKKILIDRASSKKGGEIKDSSKDATNQKSLASNLISKAGGLGKTQINKNVKGASRNKSSKGVISRGSKLGSSDQDPTKIKGSTYRKGMTSASEKDMNVNKKKTERKAGRADNSGKSDAGVGGKNGTAEADAFRKSVKGGANTNGKIESGKGRKYSKAGADGKGVNAGVGETDGKIGADEKSRIVGVGAGTYGKSGKGAASGKEGKAGATEKSGKDSEGRKGGKAGASGKSGSAGDVEKSVAGADGKKSGKAKANRKSSTGADGGKGGKFVADGKSVSGADGQKDGKSVGDGKSASGAEGGKGGKSVADGKSGSGADGGKSNQAGTGGRSGNNSTDGISGKAGVRTVADQKNDTTGVGAGGTDKNINHETTHPNIHSSGKDKEGEKTMNDKNNRAEDQNGKQELEKTENCVKNYDGRLASEVEHEFQATLTELLAECIRKRETRKTLAQPSKKGVTFTDKTSIKNTCPGIDIKDLNSRRQAELKVRTWLQITNEDDDSLCSTSCSHNNQLNRSDSAPLCEKVRCYAFKNDDSATHPVLKPDNNCGVPKREVKEGYMLRLDKQIQEMEKAFKLRNRQFLKILKKGAY